MVEPMTTPPTAHGGALSVRTATPDDAATVGDVYLRSWIAGYDGLVAEGLLRPVAEQRASHDWAAALDESDSWFGLGSVDGVAAGVAKVGPDPTEDMTGTWLELLYVAPEFWGSGISAALLSRAVEVARGSGAACMRLRVVEAQDRARSFYEREGWRPDPEVPPSRNAFFPLLCLRLDL